MSVGHTARRLAPAFFTLLVRAGLISLGAVLISAHLATHAQVLQLATDAAPIVAGLAWSALEKAWADHRLQLAIAAPAGLARPPATPPPSAPPTTALRKDPPMDVFAHLDSLRGKLAAAFAALAPEVQAALPSDFASNVDGLANDFAAEGKALASTAIAEAEAKLPPDVAPLAGDLAILVDQKIDQVNAAAQAQVAQLTAAKVALQQPAS